MKLHYTKYAESFFLRKTRWYLRIRIDADDGDVARIQSHLSGPRGQELTEFYMITNLFTESTSGLLDRDHDTTLYEILSSVVKFGFYETLISSYSQVHLKMHWMTTQSWLSRCLSLLSVELDEASEFQNFTS